jgi:hypothetical protein
VRAPASLDVVAMQSHPTTESLASYPTLTPTNIRTKTWQPRQPLEEFKLLSNKQGVSL